MTMKNTDTVFQSTLMQRRGSIPNKNSKSFVDSKVKASKSEL